MKVLYEKEHTTYICMNRLELQTWLNEQEPMLVRNINRKVYIYKNYTLFSPMDTENKKKEKCNLFILAIREEQIVGVLKLRRYHMSKHKIVAEIDKNKIPNYIGIHFLDVHMDYRRQGIATGLYTALHEWLTERDIVVGTEMTEEGKCAKLHALRNSIIKKCKVYSTYADLYHEKLW